MNFGVTSRLALVALSLSLLLSSCVPASGGAGPASVTAAGAPRSASAPTAAPAAAASPVFDVPRLERIVIDGNVDDWGDKGFPVDVVIPMEGPPRSPSDHAAKFRLGWNEEGLLVLATVWDDRAEESTSIYDADSIEMFLGSRRGERNLCQWCFSPGLSSKITKPQCTFYDWRKPELSARSAEAKRAVRRISGGYVAEFLLPWSSLDIQPSKGREAAFQIWFNDADPGRGDDYRAVWYPGTGVSWAPDHMHRIRLWDSASAPTSRACCYVDSETCQLVLRAVTPEALAGKSVEVVCDGKPISSATLGKDGFGRCQAAIRMPLPAGDARRQFSFRVEGKPLDIVDAPPKLSTLRREMSVQQTVVAFPAVFSGEQLPRIDFERPGFSEALIGPYNITVTYYDSDCKSVGSALRPGRYGAVADIRTADGLHMRRFVTLFRTPTNEPEGLGGALALPAAIAASQPAACECLKGDVESLNKWLRVGALSGRNAAVLLAASYDLANQQPESAGFWNDAESMDRQWWVGLRRTIYSQASKADQPFVCPKPAADKARVLREGTLAEAGFADDSVRRLDEFLTTWANDSDEGFNVCIARHGVIVLSKAYGQREGKPMTVETTSWIASITKLLSGTNVMMLADQGLVNLDEPIETYLPALRVPVNAKPTLRHVFSHTAGMDFWPGEGFTDYSERVGEMLDQCTVGARWNYSGTGINMGMQVAEAVSGDCLPVYFHKHLFGPLGCDTARVFEAAGSGRMNALELGKVAQMLLNKGAYGPHRFFSEETFAKMLPIRQTKILGPSATLDTGVGTTPYRTIFSDTCFGHGSASSSIIRIDLANDMFVTMCRNAAGANFTKYETDFQKLVMDCAISPVRPTSRPATQPSN